eukprot:3626218-Rhodomonas_salina.2
MRVLCYQDAYMLRQRTRKLVATPLRSYALATGSPVLTLRMLLPGGGCSVSRRSPSMLLRARYEMSGTDVGGMVQPGSSEPLSSCTRLRIGHIRCPRKVPSRSRVLPSYAPTRSLRHARYCLRICYTVLIQGMLRVYYAMSGTDMWSDGTRYLERMCDMGSRDDKDGLLGTV